MVNRGEIWIVNLNPTLGHEINKSRPAIIIQNDFGNKYSDTTIIAPVSSKNTDYSYPFEVLIPKGFGLDKDSKALLNQIRAVDKTRLLKKIGKLDVDFMEKVDEALRTSLGLN
ncbi:type II toxin-antitoxin system PemK/MazF family toxin [Candidatus Woesearchaeota archaeon]|nr:type II toxin-antitoxin system PemK/MazF family toxin [Candidatus Woesearchaeota archaeon]